MKLLSLWLLYSMKCQFTKSHLNFQKLCLVVLEGNSTILLKINQWNLFGLCSVGILMFKSHRCDNFLTRFVLINAYPAFYRTTDYNRLKLDFTDSQYGPFQVKFHRKAARLEQIGFIQISLDFQQILVFLLGFTSKKRKLTTVELYSLSFKIHKTL